MTRQGHGTDQIKIEAEEARSGQTGSGQTGNGLKYVLFASQFLAIIAGAAVLFAF